MLKKFNRFILFNKIPFLVYQFQENRIKIEVLNFIKINLKKTKTYTKFLEITIPLARKLFNIKNKYDNLYIKLFNIIPILKIECRDVPYERLNPIISNFRKEHKNSLKRIQKKYKNNEKITVLFFVSRISCFIWNNLYKLFVSDSHFDVKICVVPFCYTGKEEMIKYSLEAYNKLKEEGYNVIKAYDEVNDKYFDIKKELKPDIIFHNKSWWKHLPKQYHLTYYPESLNYLIEYGASGAKNPDGHFNLDSHWYADGYFLPSKEHLNMAHEISKIKGKNCLFLGYPKFDVFFDKSYVPNDVWKVQDKPKKRIIWAPHWLYNSGDLYSTSSFGELYDFMLEIAQKYADKIQFAFKPHPMLYKALQGRPINGELWSKDKINEYYNKWVDSSNCQFENGMFTDLFLTSDAMIFDSISFMAEYMVTGKPSLFTSSDKSVLDFDSFGIEVYSKLYHTKDLKNDIENFIQNVVLNGIDTMKPERDKFVSECLKAPNGINASENIYNYIIEKLKGEKK